MKKIITIIIFIFILILAYMFWYFNFKNIEQNPSQNQNKIIKKIKQSPKEILSEYKKMNKQDKENLTPKEREKFGRGLSNAYFLNEKLVIDVLPLLIKNTEENVEAELRVKSFNKLGNYFCDSGRFESVAQAIYKYPEMKPFLEQASGDYSLAGRKIYEKSYEILPTQQSANMLSHWYAKQILVGYDEKRKKEYIGEIHKYMDIYEKFIKIGYESKGGSYWAAMSYAALCKAGEQKYCDIYRKTIDEKSFKGSWPLLFSSYYYWIVDGDKEKAKQNMEEKFNIFEKIKNPERSSMVILWGNERKRNVKKPDLMHRAIKDMMEISPKFKTWMENNLKK